ncbi:hypothetical protein T4B_12908 [Trichinella pseudospiralis]|uniref:Uncharacterized protein n=1 Tax=Trichinella pseudospiralis TaxID=6337 RepID=A0A0V1EB00_TRIPS|nr:hypothetical protein T4A_10946 [Trichinella pseudospiralis]KRZ23107.1 hypothetical protein T4B_12908 [Trichinella pseudospiralis]
MALNSGYEPFTVAENFQLDVLRMKIRKNKNTDDTIQKSMDSTKQIKRIQEAYMRECLSILQCI